MIDALMIFGIIAIMTGLTIFTNGLETPLVVGASFLGFFAVETRVSEPFGIFIVLALFGSLYIGMQILGPSIIGGGNNEI